MKKHLVITMIFILLICNLNLAYAEDVRKVKLIPPVVFTDDTYISSDFGLRLHPVTRMKSFHAGVDIAAPIGTKIFAMTDGVVVKAERNGTAGNEIKIIHGRNVYTRYLHMDKRAVKVGDNIKTGQFIGTVGNTGRSTGPHLHFELVINNRAVNPIGIINGLYK